MGQYSLQGTQGAYESAFSERKIYLEGRSPNDAWETLEKYQDEFVPELWAQHGKQAIATGHNGSDYFVIAEFLNAVRTKQSPVDLLNAVTWSAVRPLSAQSLAEGSASIPFPDFRS